MKKSLLILLLLTACSTPKAEFTPDLQITSYDPYKGDVTVLKSTPKGKRFDTIGFVKAEGYLTNSDADIIEALKEEAAKNGANAIILHDEGVKRDIKFDAYNLVDMNYQAPKTAKAYAIRVK